jgi:PAS domain S-box-containing protein
MSAKGIHRGDSLRMLVLEDSIKDFEIICERLVDAGYRVDATRVETQGTYESALRNHSYDMILADFKLPTFDALVALRMRNDVCSDTPVLCISGSIGEEAAIELLRRGATDCVTKDRLERLPLAVGRALDEARDRGAARQAQERLALNDSLLRIAGQVARFGGWSVDLETKIVAWSDTVADIHEVPRGYAPDVAEGVRFYAPEWQERIAQVFKDCAEKGMPYDEEMELITRTGRRIWVRTTGEAIRDETGKIVKVQGSFQDITQRRRDEEALREANRQLQASRSATLSILEDLRAENEARKRKEAELQQVIMAIEQAGEVVVVTDVDGAIQYVNPAFEVVTGYSRQEALGKNPRLLKSGKQSADFYAALWQAITSGSVWRGRMVNKRKDGTLYTEDSTISPVKDGTGRIVNFVAVKRDVTEHLLLIEERINLQEQLRRAQLLESVGRLAGGIAHDFNNMLGIILGYGEVVLERLHQQDPLRKEVQEMVKAAQRSAALTRQLLAFSRRQALQPQVVDLNDLVRNLEKMLRRLIGEDIELRLALTADLGRVFVDPGQIEQVIMNLVVNARDAMPDGGRLLIETDIVELGEIDVAVHPGTAPGKYVLLRVTDTGCGMDEQVLDRVFDPFFTTKEEGRGTGLGLATVYGIVKQSGGNIWVRSQPGEGTTFEIYFPPAEAAPEPAADAEAVERVKADGHILVVEDEESLRRLMGSLLSHLGYQVTLATNGGEALLLVEEKGLVPDLIITDVIMPSMSGRQLVDRLRRGHPDLKVLYMSGYTDDAILRHGVLDDGIPFLQKPFTIRDLGAKVQDALRAGVRRSQNETELQRFRDHSHHDTREETVLPRSCGNCSDGTT